MTDVLVVGGGPAGLAAALAAARRGRAVTVVEASGRLGGMAASHCVAGQRVDLGSHRLHVEVPARVDVLLQELLGDDLQVRTRNGRLRVADSWVGFPFSTGEMVRALGVRRAAAMSAGLLAAPTRRMRADTYAEVVRTGLGTTALDVFHGPMAQKLWGRPPDELAGELARRRIAVRSPIAVARRMLKTSRPSGRAFRYPRLGYGQIVERLAEAAADAGVTVRTDAAVTALVPGRDGVRVRAGGDEVDAQHVFWTAPLATLADLVAGSPDGGSVGHRAMVLVYAVVPRPVWRPVDAHYVPTPAVACSRISEPKQYRDGPDPDDRTVVCFEVPCDVGDAEWRCSPQDWQARLDDDLARIGLPPLDAVDVEVVRLPRVYPVITPADVQPRRRLLSWASTVPGVTVFGRQGLHVGDNLHHVVEMGLSAADCLTGQGWDDEAWAQARARFATFVVAD